MLKQCKNLDDSKNTVLKIGNVRVPIRETKRPELVPTGFGKVNLQ